VDIEICTTMKNSLLFLALLVSAGAVANAATPSRVPEFTTLTGRTYRQCKISQVHPDGVSFFHSKGAAKVLYADMSDEWKKKLGYSVEREQEHQKQASMKKFLQQENEAKARQQWVANQQEQAERQLRILERAALLRERQGLLYQQQLAALYGAQVPAFGPAPAVGWPGTYFGPLNAVHGPSFGGRPWCDRGSISLASIGGGSGGYLSIRSNNCVWIGGGHAWRNPAVWQSPTLGSYIPGKFAPFGSAGPFGGVYLGGARALGQVGLGSVAWGFVPPAPAAAAVPSFRGSVSIPAAK
jgi:hypothetical protein